MTAWQDAQDRVVAWAQTHKNAAYAVGGFVLGLAVGWVLG